MNTHSSRVGSVATTVSYPEIYPGRERIRSGTGFNLISSLKKKRKTDQATPLEVFSVKQDETVYPVISKLTEVLQIGAKTIKIFGSTKENITEN